MTCVATAAARLELGASRCLLLSSTSRTCNSRKQYWSTLLPLRSSSAVAQLSSVTATALDAHNTRIKTRVYTSLRDDGACMDYCRGWAWQQLLLQRRLDRRRGRQQREADDDDAILFLEHSPVYTLGRGANENFLTFLNDGGIASAGGTDSIEDMRFRLSRTNRGPGSARLCIDRSLGGAKGDDMAIINNVSKQTNPVVAPNGVPIYRVERGGEVTFHGPGQLVVYPLLDLQRPPYVRDLHWFLRQVEEVIIETLKEYGIDNARRDDINTGVWVDQCKIAAVGVSASRWTTTHGFAINVCPDLSYFDTSVILPCGVEGRGVTSIQELLVETDAPTVTEVANVVLCKLQDIFDLTIEADGAHEPIS